MTKRFRVSACFMALLILFSLAPWTLAAGEEAWWVKQETPVDVQMTKVVYSDTAEAFAKIGQTVESNLWTDLFRDELNINVTYKFVASAGDGYDTKTQMMMASGKIPDIFPVGLSDMAELQESGMIWDMTEIYDKYLSPLSKSILEADGGAAKQSLMIGGSLWGIPQVNSVYDTLRYLCIRRDWMEKLGLEEPKSIEDLLAIMKAFVTDDPDGNGIDDTYATYVDKDMWTQLEGFFWMFGAYPNGFILKDGILQYGGTQPECKEALRTLQSMYADGWLDKEFVVKNFASAKEIVTNGKVGVIMGFHWMPFDVSGPMHDLYPDVEWDYYLWPGKDEGTPAAVMTQSALFNALVVNKKFQHPEIAAYMINLYLEKIYGETNEYDIYGTDLETGVLTYTLGPLKIITPNLNLDPYRDIMRVSRGEMTVEQLPSASLRYYDSVNSTWAARTMWGTGEHTAGTVLDFLASNPQYILQNMYQTVPTETQLERGGTLSEMRKTAYTQIITGKLDVDQGFDQFVKDYMQAGGQKIQDEVNAWYQANAK